MVRARPQWLADLSRGFKRHRGGRPGWSVEVMRDRLRVVSAELPPRPEDHQEEGGKRRSFTLSTPPGPASSAAALAECCSLYDAVVAGEWQWPDPAREPASNDPQRLSSTNLQRLTVKLRATLVGEKIQEGSWERTYQPYLQRLIDAANGRRWEDDFKLLEGVLRQWEPNSRSRQMAHDRCRRLWKEAGWTWPSELGTLRGNGKAAANPDGVRAFTDEELTELRARIHRSQKLTPADLVAWDCVICFGLRPAELKGVELHTDDGLPIARVNWLKKSSKGSSSSRTIPAVAPKGWPADCFDIVLRWKQHGLPAGMVSARSPGEVLTQQLRRLRAQTPEQIDLDQELTAYSCRHAFALRLAQRLGLHVREAAELMGHSPQVHLNAYGRRLDQPKLLARVRQRLEASMH